MSHDHFVPAWWLPSPHLQTLGARLLRSRRGVVLRRERLELPDGDFLDLDWVIPDRGPAVDGARNGPSELSPLVVVLHGLEGSAESKYALETYRALRTRELAAVGINFRSCGGEPNRLPRLYHSGETGDFRWVLGELSRRFPGRSLGAVGFSLGANVLLKYLGEAGEPEGPQGRDGSCLTAAVAISVPFDLSAGADRIERGLSVLYRRFLVEKLRRKVRAKRDLLAPHVDLGRVLSARTFRQFDELATAPLHGFGDADDYYRRSSSKDFLAWIRTPTLVIHALDDPFLPAAVVPRETIRRNPYLDAQLLPRGGHVGFVTGPPWAPVFWAERAAARYLAERLTL